MRLKGKHIAFDTETTGLSAWHGDRPFAFAFCNEELETWYAEFPVDPMTRQPKIDKHLLGEIREVLEDTRQVKVMHNGKFDTRMMESIGVKICGPAWTSPAWRPFVPPREAAGHIGVRKSARKLPAFPPVTWRPGGPAGPIWEGGAFHDTGFLAHILNTQEKSFELKYLARKYADVPTEDQDLLHKATLRARRYGTKNGWKLGYAYKEQADGSFKREALVPADYWMPAAVHAVDPEHTSAEDAALCRRYAIEDVRDRTMMLFLLFQDLLENQADLRDSMMNYDWERELWPTIYRMENRGVRLDPKGNAEEIKYALGRRQEELNSVQKHAWPGFNINSPDQLRELLYDKFKMPVNPAHMTDGGKSGIKKPSVDVDTLTDPDNANIPIVANILRYRAAAKAFQFCIQYRDLKLPDPLNPSSFVLHPDFRQLKAATGRFSCVNPNVQQVTSANTARSYDPIEGRKSFGPRPGYYWLHVDYKGMEVRVYASCANDEKMLGMIRAGQEIHDAVTNRAWGGPGNERGIQECYHVLGFDGSELSDNPLIKAKWKEWGVVNPLRMPRAELLKITDAFLAEHDYDIVAAQGSVGTKVTKNKAKMVFFGKIFGATPKAVMYILRVSYREAAEFLDYYDEEFPNMPRFARKLEAQAGRDGFITTLWGRKLMVRYNMEYQSVNYIVQGSSADLMKSAMRRCNRFLRENGIDAHIVMTIHDELVFEVAKAEFTVPLVQDLCDLMSESEGRICVPMPTEASVATERWSEKHDVILKRERKIAHV